MNVKNAGISRTSELGVAVHLGDRARRTSEFKDSHQGSTEKSCPKKKKKNQWGKAPAIEAEDLNLVHRIHVVGKKELPRVIL